MYAYLISICNFRYIAICTYANRQTYIHASCNAVPLVRLVRLSPIKKCHNYGIFITLHSKTKCMIQSFNFLLSCSALLFLNGVLIWSVLIKTFPIWGDSEDAKYVCLHTFLAICFTHGMHVQFVFTIRFKMLSVLITRQEVIRLGAFHRYEHCKGLGDTLWTRNLIEIVSPMNKFDGD